MICALAVIAEGYDLIVYGALLPSLMQEPSWEFTRAGAGAVGSAAYAGMLVGALIVGRLSDLLGRRPFVLGSIAWFTFWTIACGMAGEPWHLAVFRLLAGLGMGAMLPAVLALARELGPADRTGVVFTILMAGVPAGGMLASLVGLGVLPIAGWRAMFFIGGAISAVILILALARLPDSADFRGRRPAPAELGVLFAPRQLINTVLFPLANFMLLLTWFGLNTWLTTLMRDLNYPLSSALQFSTTLNLGALAGSFALAGLCLRWGTRRTAGLGALLASLGILGCVLQPGSTVLFLGLVALIGAGAHSALNLITASVADSYPITLRATAIGWTHGVGRVGAIIAPQLGGWILATGHGPVVVLCTFMVTALMGSALMGLLSLRGRTPEPTPV